MFGPVLVHPVKDTVKDPFAAIAGGEGARGADASAHFHKKSFNHVGGAQAAPLRGWKPEDREEFFQVGFQTVHGTRSACEPAPFPFSKARDRFLLVVGLVRGVLLLPNTLVARLLAGFASCAVSGRCSKTTV